MATEGKASAKGLQAEPFFLFAFPLSQALHAITLALVKIPPPLL